MTRVDDTIDQTAPPVQVITVLGDDPAARSELVRETVTAGSRAVGARDSRTLVLTMVPRDLHPQLAHGSDPALEIRPLDTAALVRAFVSGALDPHDEVLLALAAGHDAPLARTLVVEYVRRAVESHFWSTIVLDLGHTDSAVEILSSPGTLGRHLQRQWPAHRRYAAMAAGERADTRIQMAHHLAELCSDATQFAGGLDLVASGHRAASAIRLAELARGTAQYELSGNYRDGYVLHIPIPDAVIDNAHVDGEELVLGIDSRTVTIALPAVLQRCVMVDSASTVTADGGQLLIQFDPDPQQWPPHLASTMADQHSG